MYTRNVTPLGILLGHFMIDMLMGVTSSPVNGSVPKTPRDGGRKKAQQTEESFRDEQAGFLNHCTTSELLKYTRQFFPNSPRPVPHAAMATVFLTVGTTSFDALFAVVNTDDFALTLAALGVTRITAQVPLEMGWRCVFRRLSFIYDTHNPA